LQNRFEKYKSSCARDGKLAEKHRKRHRKKRRIKTESKNKKPNKNRKSEDERKGEKVKPFGLTLLF